jgi:hypothetical protein
LGIVSLPSTGVTGEKLSAKVPVVVTNTGPSLKGNFIVTLFADSGTTLDGTQMAVASLTKKNLSLKARQKATFTFTGEALPASLAAGTYHLVAEVSGPSGATGVVATQQTVQVAAPFVRPVLTVGRVSPGTIAVDKTGAIVVTITNTGNVLATGIVITLNPSLDGTTPVAGVVLASVMSGEKFLPNQTRKFTLHFKATHATAAGTYFPFLSVTLDGVTTTMVGSGSFIVE